MGLLRNIGDYMQIKKEIGDLTYDAHFGHYDSSMQAWDLLGRLTSAIERAKKHNERAGFPKFDLDKLQNRYDVLEIRVSEEVEDRELTLLRLARSS